MAEKFNIVGEWFLPSNKEKRIHGTLVYHPKDGANLEIYGSFDDFGFFHGFKDQEIILGLTGDSKQIVLSNCLMTKSNGVTLVKGEETGKPSTFYSARYVLIGLHVDRSEDLKFDSISSEIFNLDEWVGISGFFHDFDIEKFKNHEIQVNYKLPEPIEFYINKDAIGKINFSANTP